MKRSIAVFIILASVLFVFVFIAVTAPDKATVKEPFSNNRQYPYMIDLYQDWEEYGYPDYVGGVYSPGGSVSRLTVLLVGDDGSGESQIRGSIINTSGLSFGTAEYSYNELMAVSNEIATNYMVSGSKIYGTGIGWASSGSGGFGESGKEFRVVVTVDDGVLTVYKNKFSLLYGDMVEVEAGSPMEPLSGTSSGNI